MTIEIATADDLYDIKNNTSGEYVQTADIDLSSFSNWEPIGNTATEPPFSGSYDGQGYTIKNLTINRQSLSCVGLFSQVGYASNNAVLKNIILENVDIVGKSLVGGIVGLIYGAEIVNCHITGNIQGVSEMGGILGISQSNDDIIEKCSANINISTESHGTNQGGLIAVSYAKVINSYAVGKVGIGVSSDNIPVGGLIGNNNGAGTIENSYAACEVYEKKESTVTGGLIGVNAGSTVDNCYYDTEVSGQSDTGKGIPKTTSEMKKRSTYEGWDFGNAWYIYLNTNDGYPVLIENPYEIYFIEPPKTTIQPIQATSVTVKSPEAEYTAELDSMPSADKQKEKFYEIESGNEDVCQQVAERMLSYLSKEKTSLSGKILNNQDVDFKQKVRIYNPEAMLNKDMILQNINHDIIAQETTITCGDLILSDTELLARILDELL